MDKKTQKKLLDKQMTRREFLQFAGASLLVLFGLSNIVALLNHAKRTAEAPDTSQAKASTGFGSRKFGV
ncbi:MAG TPA: hypothetical protein VFH06_00740 [Candidatus Saccharimonadales bacterium]|nr:hypothetical protein [Candidatus Saccharimonadales bacterium]